MFGLGFYIYKNESFPSEEADEKPAPKPKAKAKPKAKKIPEVTLLVDNWEEALNKYLEHQSNGFSAEKIIKSLATKYEVKDEKELEEFLEDVKKRS